MTIADKKAVWNMGIEDAITILARKPKGLEEFTVARIALLALRRWGMSLKEIQKTVGRKLTFGEQVVLAEAE